MRRDRCLAVLLLLVLSSLAYAAEPKEKRATGAKAAADWVTLLDNGKFGDAWKQLSPSQRPNGSKDKWQSDVSRYRHQVGKLHDRKLISADYTTKVPGAEDGEYVVVTFLSSFERLGSALEIVVPQLLPDGSWVISGYSIKPADATE